jgi:uncharacterized protein (AIM24 family)
VDVEAIVAPSGWVELPAIRDMARLEFGRSSLQIEGLYVPVADFHLAPGDGVYFTHHVLLWKDPGVPITVLSLAKGFTRLFAGLPLVMTEARGPGHIAFSMDSPGEMVALPLQPGEAIDVREHVFLAAFSATSYDWFTTNVWYGVEKETHYPVGRAMDRFQAGSEPGLVVIHGHGNVFEKRLGPYESILVKPSALLFKDTSVAMHLHGEVPLSWGGRYGPSGRYGSGSSIALWLRLYGPGRVAIQSAFRMDRVPYGRAARSSVMTRFDPGRDAAFGRRPRSWYLKDGGEARGPFRDDQIQGLVLVGRVSPETLVYREGLQAPVRAGSVSGIGALSPFATLSLPRPCPSCGTLSAPTRQIAARGWVAFLLLLVFCFPLSFVGLLIRERQCPRCGRRF